MKNTISLTCVVIKHTIALMLLFNTNVWAQTQYKVVHANSLSAIEGQIIDHSNKVNMHFNRPSVINSPPAYQNAPAQIALIKSIQKDNRQVINKITPHVAPITPRSSSWPKFNADPNIGDKNTDVTNNKSVQQILTRSENRLKKSASVSSSLTQKEVAPAMIAKADSQTPGALNPVKYSNKHPKQNGTTIKDAARHIALIHGFTLVQRPGDELLLNTPVNIIGHQLKDWQDLKKIAPNIKNIELDNALRRARVVPNYG